MENRSNAAGLKTVDKPALWAKTLPVGWSLFPPRSPDREPVKRNVPAKRQAANGRHVSAPEARGNRCDGRPAQARGTAQAGAAAEGAGEDPGPADLPRRHAGRDVRILV